MIRLQNYIETFIYPDLIEKGYLYLSDNNLFVIDELSEFLEKLNFDLNFQISGEVYKNVLGEALVFQIQRTFFFKSVYAAGIDPACLRG